LINARQNQHHFQKIKCLLPHHEVEIEYDLHDLDFQELASMLKPKKIS